MGFVLQKRASGSKDFAVQQTNYEGAIAAYKKCSGAQVLGRDLQGRSTTVSTTSTISRGRTRAWLWPRAEQEREDRRGGGALRWPKQAKQESASGKSRRARTTDPTGFHCQNEHELGRLAAFAVSRPPTGRKCVEIPQPCFTSSASGFAINKGLCSIHRPSRRGSRDARQPSCRC